MKPAPPVTSNLATPDLRQYGSESLPPMNWGKPQSAQRRTIEDAVRRTPSRRRVLTNRDGDHAGVGGNDAQSRGLLSDCNCEVVPARDPGICPVVNACDIRPFDQPPERRGYRSSRRRGTNLVGYHTHRAIAAHDAEHGVHEVAALRGVEPRRTHDDRATGQEPAYGALTGELGMAV